VPVILPNAAPASNQPEKESARVRLVSGDYFAALGIAPAAGRLFTPEVDRVRNGSPLAVISYAFWKRRFGLSPVVLGNSLQIHNTSFQIVGVAPPGFFGETVGDAPDIWLPLMMQDSIYPGRDPFSPSGVGGVNQYMWLQVMGRLKPGASIAQAKADINVSFQHMLESIVSTGFSPEDRKQALNQQINVQPGSRGPSTLQSDFGQPLKFLMALVGLILLIACANVANLLLARGAKRQKEFALRLAVGAGRTRIVRQLFTESLLLAALGAAAGVLMAYWADALLLNMVSGSSGPNAVHLNLQPDARVLAFTLGVTVFTAVLFSLSLVSISPQC
jgi:predicted permease